MKSTHTGLKRILKAFQYSYDGFIASFQSEAALRQDMLFCTLASLSLFFLPVTATQVALMLFALILILMMELINTAIEVIIDRIGSEYNVLSKKAKDIGSLLVFISFINMIAVWGIILVSVW